MKITLIAAMANGRVIAKDQKMPWHLSADLKHFKALTMGKAIIMGRKTFESIGTALPGRHNIIITRNKNFQAENCSTVHCLPAAFELTKNDEEIMIIGGAELYRQTLDRADCLQLTFIHADFPGDTFFPAWQQPPWEIVEQQDFEADETTPFAYSFVTLMKVSPSG